MSAPQDRFHRPDANDMIPAGIIRGMIALALGSLLLVGWARLTDRPLVGVPPESAVVEEREIRLLAERDQPGMTVTDAQGNVLLVLDNGGFLSAVHAGLRHHRARHGLSPDLPVRLVEYADGRLSVQDDLTGFRVDPASFGTDTRAAFARFLTD